MQCSPVQCSAVQCSGFYGDVRRVDDFSDGGCSQGGESGVTLGSSCGCCGMSALVVAALAAVVVVACGSSGGGVSVLMLAALSVMVVAGGVVVAGCQHQFWQLQWQRLRPLDDPERMVERVWVPSADL